MTSPLLELLVAIIVVSLLLGVMRFCQRRGYASPPLRLPLIAALLSPFFDFVGFILPDFLRTNQTQQYLQAADELIVYLAAAQLASWLVFQFPADINIVKPTAKIIRDLSFFIASIIIAIIVVQNNFSINLVGLAATSAVLTAVIGLAAQETLKNLFAGVSLELDSPFQVGDWIKIDNISGVIISLRLMTTRIKTITGDTVIIPNSKICNQELTRIRKGTPAGQVIDIGLDYSLPPHRAIHLITSVLRRHLMILENPEPYVKLDHFADSAIIYKIYIWQKNPSESIRLRSEVLEHLWYTIHRDGQTVPFPVTEVIFKEKANAPQLTKKSSNENLELIKNLEYFRQFETPMLEKLLDESSFHNYGAGETVIEEGQTGDSLYVLIEGCLQAFKADPQNHTERLLNTLKPVAIVGEMAFHTGQPRSATIRCLDVSTLLEIKRSSMVQLIQADPSLLEKIGTLISERQAQLVQVEHVNHPIKENLIIAMMKEIFLKSEDD